jgi:hypothetical protein
VANQVGPGRCAYHLKAWSRRRARCTLPYSSLILRMRPLRQSTVIRADFTACRRSGLFRERVIVTGYCAAPGLKGPCHEWRVYATGEDS